MAGMGRGYVGEDETNLPDHQPCSTIRPCLDLSGLGLLAGVRWGCAAAAAALLCRWP